MYERGGGSIIYNLIVWAFKAHEAGAGYGSTKFGRQELSVLTNRWARKGMQPMPQAGSLGTHRGSSNWTTPMAAPTSRAVWEHGRTNGIYPPKEAPAISVCSAGRPESQALRTETEITVGGPNREMLPLHSCPGSETCDGIRRP